MEENNQIPDDVVEEILQFLPTKSLARFISVRKKWRTMIFNQIDNSKDEGFLVASSSFVQYFNLTESDESETNPVNLLQFLSKDHISVVGCVNGLVLCLHTINKVLILHNPLTQAHRKINSRRNPADYTVHGIGYDKSKDDYVIVIVARSNSNVFSWAQIWTSKTKNWVPRFKVLDPEWYIFSSRNCLSYSLNTGLFVNRCLYWKLWKLESVSVAGLLCFELETREFKVIEAPKGLFLNCFVLGDGLSVAKFGESERLCTDVWNVSGQGNWKKIMSIPCLNSPLYDYELMLPAFRLKNGEFVCVSYKKNSSGPGDFYLYNEQTQTYTMFKSTGLDFEGIIFPYKKSLVSPYV